MYLESVEKKLREAESCLTEMREQEARAFGDKERFDFQLSAFLNAGRTVDYRLRHEHGATYKPWRKRWDASNPKEATLIKFFVDDRNLWFASRSEARGLALTACAGRDPQPVASVQPQDMYADCTMIRAEIEGNNVKMKELADERGWKVTQNVLTGLAGFVVPVIWFGMDWKGAVDKDAAALQARQQYLTTLAEQRCAPGYRPPPPPSGPYVPQAYSQPPRQ